MSKNQIEGATKKIMGGAKEAIGKAVGNEQAQVEGAAEKALGAAQEALGKAQDKLGDAIKK